MAWRRSGKLFHLVHFCETALMYLIATHKKCETIQNVCNLYSKFTTTWNNSNISLSRLSFFFFFFNTYRNILQDNPARLKGT